MLSGVFWGVGITARKAVLRALTPKERVFSTASWAFGEIVVYEPFWPEDLHEHSVEVTLGGRTVYRSPIAFPVGQPVRVQMDGYGVVDGVALTTTQGNNLAGTTTYVFAAPVSDLQWSPGTPPTASVLSTIPFIPYTVLSGGYFPPQQPAEGPSIWRVFEGQYQYLWNPRAWSPVPSMLATLDDGRVSYLDADAEADMLAKLEPEAGNDLAAIQAVAIRKAMELARNPASGVRVWSGPLLEVFFDLAYAGHAREAWRFFREAYPAVRAVAAEESSDRGLFESPDSLEAWEKSILNAMGGSPLFDEVLRRNGGSVEPPPRK